MELSAETVAAIQSAFEFFVAGGELTKQMEAAMSAHIQNIIDIAVEPEIKALACESRDYWNGFIVTDSSLYPRLSQWRMNGMFRKLTDMAMQAGLDIFEDHQCTAVPAPENSTD